MVKCPFCGEQENLITVMVSVGNQQNSHNEYFVQCYNCGAQGPNELSRKSALESWNRRRESKPVPYEFREG